MKPHLALTSCLNSILLSTDVLIKSSEASQSDGVRSPRLSPKKSHGHESAAGKEGRLFRKRQRESFEKGESKSAGWRKRRQSG